MLSKANLAPGLRNFRASVLAKQNYASAQLSARSNMAPNLDLLAGQSSSAGKSFTLTTCEHLSDLSLGVFP